jgi:hypothetical protein
MLILYKCLVCERLIRGDDEIDAFTECMDNCTYKGLGEFVSTPDTTEQVRRNLKDIE